MRKIPGAVTASDRSPLYICPTGLEPIFHSKPLRFEKKWLSNKGCTEIVEVVWNPHDFLEPHFRVINKVSKGLFEIRLFY